MLRYTDRLPARVSRSWMPRFFDRPSYWGEGGFGFVSPFDWVREMDREMDRLFSGFFSGMTGSAPALAPLQVWTPTFDLYETVDDWVIRAELPDIDPNDLEVTTTGQELTVRGQTRQEQEDRQEGSSWTARRSSNFQCTFPLPPTVQQDAVTAEYQNGILEIHLPKTEEAKRQVRRVPILSGPASDQPAIEGEKPTEAPSAEAGANGAAAAGSTKRGATGTTRRRSRKED